MYWLLAAAMTKKDAAAILEEGMAKGIMPADGKNYSMLAQAHYFSDNIPAAIAAASPVVLPPSSVPESAVDRQR